MTVLGEESSKVLHARCFVIDRGDKEESQANFSKVIDPIENFLKFLQKRRHSV
jgi:hypothetical protein